MLIKLLLGNSLKAIGDWKFVKLSLNVNVMFEDTYEYQVTILEKDVCIEEAQCNIMEVIGNKHISVLFGRVALVRMGRLGPQERRERRYDRIYQHCLLENIA